MIEPMIDPMISMTILDFRSQFIGGDLLRWEFQLDAVENERVVAVENSVLWYTSGKGDEDIGVHFFERRVPKKNESNDLVSLRRFESVLPDSPVSYDGFLLKINWCVRVRAFLKGGKEFSEEIPFGLKRKHRVSRFGDQASASFRVVGA
ncbi:MAG: hypothetical protein P8M80_16325 [Pirellulaceae bacterium]|jgi:hypothetical protein|nr:hypothetical protein [bacterium]MDB4793926.1 hypothetical protein [Pirellulaceae bacterium]MDG2470848.1 hypothetical protein [Pirellulaceae bacterium]